MNIKQNEKSTFLYNTILLPHPICKINNHFQNILYLYGLCLGTLPYCWVVWIKPNYYFMNTFLHYYINTCSKLLPNKYMELNETKAIAGVPMPVSYSLYNYFTDTHPILIIIIKIENYKI